jgi:glycosyltransferase involved in cell wall biosynthesis
MKNRIVAIIPFYNVSGYIKQCYNSLIDQQYSDFHLVFSDDCSNDGSLALVPDGPNITKMRQEKRVFALSNICNTILSLPLQDDDILLIIDGDDYLLHRRVFHKINEFYGRTGCLLSYGQYCSDKGAMGHCSPYTANEFKNLRSLKWRASHLKTFRSKLFSAYLEQDPALGAYKDDNGQFYPMAYDVALMHPLLEIAGYENVFFNREVLYVYRLHSFNDMHVNIALQLACERHIQAQKPFNRIF